VWRLQVLSLPGGILAEVSESARQLPVVSCPLSVVEAAALGIGHGEHVVRAWLSGGVV